MMSNENMMKNLDDTRPGSQDFQHENNLKTN